ncbi:MAG: Calcineurin-like phosphoesterase [Friedmanniella sp.]|nr:Calcineurin-like phosphoesterase [Friedmanniella sp.]
MSGELGGISPTSATTPARRVAVVGDVAGHLEDLRAELVRLGADPETGELPDDLTVIQVGDLVHRGPDSDGVVSLVDHYLTTQPRSWIQLVGNHEAQYLREPAFTWPEQLSEASAAALRRWWATGQMRVAASVSSGTEQVLVTHAGLTADFWRDILGSLPQAATVEAALNSLIGEHDAVLFRSGQMLGGGRADRRAGPTWAATATELVPSWVGEALPFSQVHGHSSVYDWQARAFAGPAAIAQLTTLDAQAKHATVTLTGGRIVGVDPGHGRRPQRPWRSWELAMTVRRQPAGRSQEKHI